MGVLGEYYKHRRLMSVLTERVEEMNVEIERLRAALLPFAEAFDAVSPYDAITLGDLRRAKAALRGEGGGIMESALKIISQANEIARLNEKVERLLDLIDSLVEAADDDWSETVGKPIIQEAVAYLVGDKK